MSYFYNIHEESAVDKNLRSDLVSTLTGLNVNYFTHFSAENTQQQKNKLDTRTSTAVLMAAGPAGLQYSIAWPAARAEARRAPAARHQARSSRSTLILGVRA